MLCSGPAAAPCRHAGSHPAPLVSLLPPPSKTPHCLHKCLPLPPRSLLWLPAGHALRLLCHALVRLLPPLLRGSGEASWVLCTGVVCLPCSACAASTPVSWLFACVQVGAGLGCWPALRRCTCTMSRCAARAAVVPPPPPLLHATVTSFACPPLLIRHPHPCLAGAHPGLLCGLLLPRRRGRRTGAQLLQAAVPGLSHPSQPTHASIHAQLKGNPFPESSCRCPWLLPPTALLCRCSRWSVLRGEERSRWAARRSGPRSEARGAWVPGMAARASPGEQPHDICLYVNCMAAWPCK